MSTKETLDLTTAEGRDRLKPRPAPYYVKIGRGQYIGLRRNASGDVWTARLRAPVKEAPGTFEQHYTTLGAFAGYPEATAAAWEWFTEVLGRRPRNAPGIGTVAECCTQYLEGLRLTKAKSEKRIRAAENLLRNATLDAIGAIECEKLTALDVVEWRERLLRGERVMSDARYSAKHPAPQQLRPVAASTVNRIKKQLFAALSAAADSGRLTNRNWQIKKNLIETVERPGQYIEDAHAVQLRDAAEGRFRDYVVCIMATGARPVELQRATRADLDLTKAVATITLVSFKGRNAVKRTRVCGIPAEARAAFERFAKDKVGKAALFTRDDGQPMLEKDTSLEFTALAERAGLPQYRLYDTRHTRITNLLRNKVPPSTVSKQTGTSLQMIDRHYSKVLGEQPAQVAAVGF